MKYLIAFMSLFCVAFATEYPKLKSLSDEEERFFIYRMHLLESCLVRLQDLIYAFEFPDTEKNRESIAQAKNDVDQCLYLIGVRELILRD